MKGSHVSILLIALFALSLNSGCKEDPVVTPVSELLIGNWQSTERQKDGITLPISEGYRELSISDSLILIYDFESDGAEKDNWEDTWSLLENDTRLNLDASDPFDMAEIIYIDEDSLVIEYDAFDVLLGTARYLDTYAEFE